MSNLSKYEAVLLAAKELVKAEKDVTKKSDKAQSLTIEGSTRKQRASANDRLTDACFDRDKARDNLHKYLVDAGLADAKASEEYEARQISQNAGLGHTIRKSYQPAKPNSVSAA